MKVWAYRTLRRISRLAKSLKPVRHTEYFYVHDLNEIPDAEPRVPVSLSILKRGESEKVREIWPVDLKKIEERLKEGHLCFLGTLDNLPVSYHWVQTSGMHFVQPAGKDMSIDEGRFMIYHTRVADEVKGKRINPFVICTILTEMKNNGYTEGLIYTASTNISNQKSLERIGFKKITEVSSLKLGKRFYSNWKATL